MKYKCPACGYQPDKAQAQIETKLLFNNFPKDIQENLKRIISEVSKHLYHNRIPVEYKYRFIYGLSPISHSILRKTISLWKSFQYSKTGKGLQYFVAIAKSAEETQSAQKTSELKMRGTNPPDLTNPEPPKKENKNDKLLKKATAKRRQPKF